MPIYEYECKSCGHRCELLEKMSDTPTETCPECQKKALKRLISAAAFHLKGSGWYVTDFRDKDKKGATEGSAKSQDQSQSKSADANNTKSAGGTKSNDTKASEAKSASESAGSTKVTGKADSKKED